MAREFVELGWVVVSEPDPHGIRRVSLTEEGSTWLAYSRGNTWGVDLARLPQAASDIEWARAAFRVHCEKHGVDHGHRDVDVREDGR